METTGQAARDGVVAPTTGCPRCGTRPALRISGWVVEKLAGEPPERRVESYRCQRRNCGMIYDITAGALVGGR